MAAASTAKINAGRSEVIPFPFAYLFLLRYFPHWKKKKQLKGGAGVGGGHNTPENTFSPPSPYRRTWAIPHSQTAIGLNDCLISGVIGVLVITSIRMAVGTRSDCSHGNYFPAHSREKNRKKNCGKVGVINNCLLQPWASHLCRLLGMAFRCRNSLRGAPSSIAGGNCGPIFYHWDDWQELLSVFC